METLLHIILTAYIGMNGADLAITEHCLGAGQCRELNPIFAPLGEHPVVFGAAKMSITGATSVYLITQHKKHPKLTLIAGIVGTAVVTGATIHNVRQLRR